MDFKTFDKTEQKAFRREAESRWGGTAAWLEYEQKTAAGAAKSQKSANEGLMKIFAEIGELKDLPVEDAAVRRVIAKLQNHITGHFYTCTDDILAGLGKMYAADPRFRENIDRAGGAGTADFAADAIEYFCKNKS